MIDQIIALQKEIVQGRDAMLPAMDKYILWFSRLLAENLVKRDALVAERAALDVRMAAALEEGKVNAWKRKDKEKKESASVQSINKEIADLGLRMDALIQEAAPAQKAVDVYKRWEKENDDTSQWKNGGDEPEHIRRREEAELARLRSGFVALRFDPNHPVWSPDQEDQENQKETWVNITPDSYLETLKPKPTPVSEIMEEQLCEAPPTWMLRYRKK